MIYLLRKKDMFYFIIFLIVIQIFCSLSIQATISNKKPNQVSLQIIQKAAYNYYELNFSNPSLFRYDASLVNFSNNELKLKKLPDGKYSNATIMMSLPIRVKFIDVWQNITLNAHLNGQKIGFRISQDDCYYYYGEYSSAIRSFSSFNKLPWANLTEINSILPNFPKLKSKLNTLYLAIRLFTNSTNTPIITSLRVYYSTSSETNPLFPAPTKYEIENKYNISLDSEFDEGSLDLYSTEYFRAYVTYVKLPNNISVFHLAENTTLSHFLIFYFKVQERPIALTLNFLSFGIYNDSNSNNLFDKNETYWELDVASGINEDINRTDKYSIKKIQIGQNITKYTWGFKYSGIPLTSFENATGPYSGHYPFDNMTSFAVNYTITYNASSKEVITEKEHAIGTIYPAAGVNLNSGNYGFYMLYSLNYLDLEAQSVSFHNEEGNLIEPYHLKNLTDSEGMIALNDQNLGGFQFTKKNTYDLVNETSGVPFQSNLKVDNYILTDQYTLTGMVNKTCGSQLYQKHLNILNLSTYYIPDLVYFEDPVVYTFPQVFMGLAPINLMSVFPTYNGSQIINDPIFALKFLEYTPENELPPNGTESPGINYMVIIEIIIIICFGTVGLIALSLIIIKRKKVNPKNSN